MADDRRNGEPTELVYLPEPSWQPVLLAAGLAGVVASLFTWWPYGVVGAVVAAGRALGLDPRRTPELHPPAARPARRHGGDPRGPAEAARVAG